MKITIRVFMIAAVVILALTMLAMLIVIGFQDFLTQELFGLNYSAASFFAVPFAPIIQTLFMLIATTVLCIFINNQKLGIVFEIIFLVFAIMLLPLVMIVVNYLQPLLISNYAGAFHHAKYSCVAQLCSYVSVFLPFANGLSLVSCGMSIGRKCTKKLS